MLPPGPRYRWLFVAALVAGTSYWLGGQHVGPALWATVWKASGVALLALWAARNARSRDGWLIAAVMLLGALGDVLIEYDQKAGAAAFLARHVVAIALYLTHRRATPSPSQVALAAALFVGTPLIAFLLPADRGTAPTVACYALGLGAMAASAWISRFPRYRVGLGAVLFVASDLLIFARSGPLSASVLPGLSIWPLYFGGQALIAWGVVTTLARWRDDDDLHHRL